MGLKKVEKKESLNIKIPGQLNKRLQRARKIARENGAMFNVSKIVEELLEKEVKKVERKLGIERDIRDEIKQIEIELN